MVSIRKQTKALQVLPGENKILYHSNRVSRGRYLGMTQLQISLFIEVMIRLQQPIKRSMEGKDYSDLFDIISVEERPTGMELAVSKQEHIRVGIFLKDVVKHNHYNKVIEAAKSVGNIRIELQSPLEKNYTLIESLFPRIEGIKKENGRSVLYVHIPVGVAKKLVEIDRNEYGKPIRYTSYMMDVVRKAKKSKYTFKMYWLISAWKDIGKMRVKFEDLKKELGVNGFYDRYSSFKKRVIIPVQKELEELNSDCLFEVQEERDNQKASYLNFQIFSKKSKYQTEEFSKKINAGLEIKQLLAEKFNFETVHMDFFNEKIRTHKNYNEDKCLYKIKSITKWLEKPLNRMEVVSLPDYMLTSLSKFFYQEEKILG